MPYLWSNEFYISSEEKSIDIWRDSSVQSNTTITISVDGYKDLVVTIDKNGSIVE